MKKYMHRKIPKVIYMCHKNLDCLKMPKSNLIKLNPEYEVKLFDNDLCETFLLNNFSSLHCDIFKFLVDGPIKADFWRCCILYKNGGIYMDSDIEPIVPFREYVVKDIDFLTCISGSFRKTLQKSYNKPCYNPHIIMARKGDKILKDCIRKYIKMYEEKIPYSYWGYSITTLMENINNILIDGVYLHNKKKYQFIIEKYKERHSCYYKGKLVLYNRYLNYHNHKFDNY
jgi:mannosyltransferase OCH1-like enzyme